MYKCRICLVTCKRSCSISDLRDDKSLKFMITTIANIKIEDDDAVTDKICLKCSQKVVDAYYFKTQILRSNEILQGYPQGDVKKVFFNDLNDIRIKCGIENIVPKLEHSDVKMFIGEDSIHFNNTTIKKIKAEDIAEINQEINDYFHVDEDLNNEEISRSNDDVSTYEPDAIYDQTRTREKNRSKEKNITKLQTGKVYKPSRSKFKATMIKVSIKPVVMRDIKICYTRVNEAEKKKDGGTLCNFCGIMSKSIRSHILKHTGKIQNRTYECDLCGKCFLHRNLIIQHLNKHSGGNGIKCNICGVVITDRRQMESHLITHSNEKKYTCNICNKKYKRKNSLRRHFVTHYVANKNIKCEHCNMTFFTKCKLRHHLRVHTGERPFNCEICSQPYSYKHDFNRHCLKKHGVFLSRRSVYVMNEEVRQRERALMRNLMINIREGHLLNPFEGPQGVLAFKEAIKALKGNKIPLEVIS